MGCGSQTTKLDNSMRLQDRQKKQGFTQINRMPAIDTHVHLVISPSSKALTGHVSEPMKRMTGPIETRASFLNNEMSRANIETILAMPTRANTDTDPLGIQETLEIAKLAPGIKVIGLADPRRTDTAHLKAVERLIEDKRNNIVAFKSYLGYFHYGPDDPAYLPYIKLAEKYNLVMIFHTGDVYTQRGRIKFSHPSLVDEVAVAHPNVRFVIAHVGVPWHIDAAEVVWKNDNVWTDVSGLYIGTEESLDQMLASKKLPDAIPGLVISELKSAITFMNRYDRVLYASDWPFCYPMSLYRRFIEAIIPEEHYEKVFRTNAEKLFMTNS
jgi:predicted TIM-barrel fold metal-dependent hydrolase